MEEVLVSSSAGSTVPALLLQLGSSGSFIGGLLPMVAIFAIFYFLLFMPMQRQKKKHQRMLTELKNGDMVQTNGGIIGTIVAIQEKDDALVLRVKPDNVKLQIARSAVSGRLGEEAAS